MELRLRDALPRDDSFLLDVFSSARQAEMALMGWEKNEAVAFLQTQFEFQNIDYKKHFPDAHRLIIVLDEEPSGRLVFIRKQTNIRIIVLELLPLFQSKGYGSYILKQLQAEAADQGVSVCLNVAVDNTRAQRLFCSHGFYATFDDGVYLSMEWRPEGKSIAASEDELSEPRPVIADGARFEIDV